jgi:hypothetical protein
MGGPFVQAARALIQRGSARRSTALALGLLASSCVLDTDARCGRDQVFSDERCVCADGTIYTAAGCVPCREGEVASALGCVCGVGYARSTPDAACEPIPYGIGLECASDSECLNAEYPHCQSSPLGDAYCTSAGCDETSVCGAGYACDLGATPAYCRRPPVGVGQACSSDADCAGGEAAYCDQGFSSTCLVKDCTLAPDDCFPGTECCDLSSFALPTLCVAPGTCPL